MNFWEARQAALEGKKVKRVGDKVYYSTKAFTDITGWDNSHIASLWEIVEEPKATTSYLNIYSDFHGSLTHKSISEANDHKGKTAKSQIEIVTDANGKLISAKNV
jgi:uncharacterized protein YfaP (DUF2135 family)